MIRSEPLVGSDVRLERLRALDDDARERAIADLIVSVAQPIAAHVIRRYTGDGGAVPEADAEDILSGVALRVLVKLRSLGEAEDVIRSFDDYVAMLAYNAVSDHLRYRYPMRTRARNRVRYVLAHDARLELWSSGKRLVGGLAGWKKTIAAARDEGVSLPDAVRRRMSDGDRPADDLVILFEHTGRPLPLDLLVDLCAAAWRMIDAALPPPAEKASEPAALANLELREQLQTAWREIVQLRPMQRRALLLNLRTAGIPNALMVFETTGIAGHFDIAKALDITPSELAAIWSQLPLDDLRIAAMMGTTRQRVISLRRSARERLTRRLGKFWGP